MTNREIEEDLAKHGFTSKDIGIIRQYVGQNGDTYPSLLNLLKKRFIFSVIFFIFLLCITGYEVITKDIGYLYADAIVWFTVGPIIWFMMSMKLGFKAFKYSLKNRHHQHP